MFNVLSVKFLSTWHLFFFFSLCLSTFKCCDLHSAFISPSHQTGASEEMQSPADKGRESRGLCVVGMAIGQLTTLDCHDAIFRTWALLRNTFLSRAAARYHPRSNIHSEGVGGGPPSPAHLPLELPPGDPRRERSIGPISRCLLSKFPRPSAT